MRAMRFQLRGSSSALSCRDRPRAMRAHTRVYEAHALPSCAAAVLLNPKELLSLLRTLSLLTMRALGLPKPSSTKSALD